MWYCAVYFNGDKIHWCCNQTEETRSEHFGCGILQRQSKRQKQVVTPKYESRRLGSIEVEVEKRQTERHKETAVGTRITILSLLVSKFFG